MFTISHDYYAILGVAKDATTEEIKNQYKRLIKENHPDQYLGLQRKYEQLGDEELLKVIEEKIQQAEEMCKLLNEACDVLSDPIKRKQYDEQVYEEQVYEPAVEEPEIFLSPTMIDFGSLNEGQRKSKSFIVENKGGLASSINIDWESTKPDWGELVIEPDPDNTFPIKVSVVVNTTGIPSGAKKEKILINTDGKVYLVEIFLSVKAVTEKTVSTKKTAATPPAAPIKKPVKNPLSKEETVRYAVLAILLWVGIFYQAISMGLRHDKRFCADLFVEVSIQGNSVEIQRKGYLKKHPDFAFVVDLGANDEKYEVFLDVGEEKARITLSDPVEEVNLYEVTMKMLDGGEMASWTCFDVIQ